jgi:hypothetical protein
MNLIAMFSSLDGGNLFAAFSENTMACRLYSFGISGSSFAFSFLAAHCVAKVVLHM